MATTTLLLHRSLRFLNSTVKSSPQGHLWISLARPFSSRRGVNYVIYVNGNDLDTTNSSVVRGRKRSSLKKKNSSVAVKPVMEKELEDRAHFEVRKRAEMVIWNIQMIKMYRNKIPGEIVDRMVDEVLDLRKTMGRRSVISEMKSKLDEYLSRWRNDQRVWGSGDHSGLSGLSGGGEQGGYNRGEASWDHSGSDIHTMKKILNEYGDKVPSDMAREIEGAIGDLETAMEGGNADEIKAKLDDANKAVSKIGEHMYGGSEFDGHEPGYKESCLNNWECHEGEASKHYPDALGGGSDAYSGGFDDFGGGFDSSGSSDW